MHVPLSTYRLQLHAGFTLDDAADLTPYLAGLGADTCYTSPYFTANPGSMHGYDVCDHNAINPELGGPEAHARFVARLSGLGLGHMIGFVPNHMGVGTGTNAWWRDVLENGPGAPGADAPTPGDGVKVPPDLGDLVGRLRAYMLKAVKEAKRHTSWLTPNEEYEQAVTRFVDRVLTGPGSAKFLSTIAPFARRVARVGMINGLSRAAPGRSARQRQRHGHS